MRSKLTRLTAIADAQKGFQINEEDIRKEFSIQRPQWILSTYGPGKNPPASLLEGNEYSPEELRVRFYERASKGEGPQADEEAVALWNKAEQAYAEGLSRINNVLVFEMEEDKKHPNRNDFCKMDGTKSRDQYAAGFTSQSASGFGTGTGFGQPAAPASNPFSKAPTSSFGQPSGSSAFGQPAFGQGAFGGNSTQPGTAFGQQQPTPAFGQGAFGKPALGNTGFGQPAFGSGTLGQPAQNNPFAPAAASGGFGQTPSAFGQPTQSNTAFEQPSQPQSTAFGQPSQTQSGFGQPAFGKPVQAPSAFGQPGAPAFGQGAFGKPTDAPFGSEAPAQVNNNPFAPKHAATPSNDQPMDSVGSSAPAVQPTGFGNSTVASANRFAAAADPRRASSVVTEPPPPAARGSGASHPLTGEPAVPLHYTQTLPNTPPQKDAKGKLISFRGQRVRYVDDPPKYIEGALQPPTSHPCYERPDGKGLERIWFIDGADDMNVRHLNKDDKKGDLEPQEQMTEDDKANYKHLARTGKFKDGKLPEAPPMRDMVDYDF